MTIVFKPLGWKRVTLALLMVAGALVIICGWEFALGVDEVDIEDGLDPADAWKDGA